MLKLSERRTPSVKQKQKKTSWVTNSTFYHPLLVQMIFSVTKKKKNKAQYEVELDERLRER